MNGVYAHLVADFEAAVFEHRGGRAFAPLTALPAWFDALWPREFDDLRRPGDRSLFLDAFLDRALPHWEGGSEERLASGAWSETANGDVEYLLEATARTVEGRPLLILRLSPRHQSHDLYQQAREQRLAYEQLLQEINKREILLHCIVHDLSNPLSGIKGSLTLLAQDELVAADGLDLLRVGLNQAEKMHGAIRSILGAFAEDVRRHAPSLAGTEIAPDLLACASNVVASLAATATLRGVSVSIEPMEDDGRGWKVVGEGERLERVFFNLLANALRYATEGERIVLRLAPADVYIEASVEDEGPGVPEALVDSLFTRFAQGEDRTGLAGLGLYFCRITVEQWGGQIGYRPAPAGGACFWFRLPRPAA